MVYLPTCGWLFYGRCMSIYTVHGYYGYQSCVCVCGCWRFSLCPLTFNDFPGSFEMMTTRKDDIQRLTREEMMISWKRALPENGQTDNICGNFLALSTSGVMKIGFVSGYFPKKSKHILDGLWQVFVLIEFGAKLIEEIVDRKQRKSMEIHLTKEQAPIK